MCQNKESGKGDDAGAYVNAIMGSQPIAPVANNASPPRSRKRHLSMPDSSDSITKKVRNDCDSSERVLASARRSLYGKTPASKGSKGEDANTKDNAEKRSMEDTSSSDNRRGTDKMSADKESNAADKNSYDSSAVLRTHETNDNVRTSKVDTQDHSMTDMLKNISGELKLLNGRIADLEQALDRKHESLGERIDQLENRLERKLSEKMAQIMDKRFTSEMKKLQREMDTRLSDIRADFQTDISEMAAKVESVSEGVNSGGQVDGIARNVVIRELPEHEGENTLVKVNNLFRDQLKLRDVSAIGAVRKESIGRKPGVVVVTFESLEDKQKVLKSKKLLKNSMMKKVYIHPDQTLSERLQHANLRALVDAINRGDGKITVRGDRIVKNDLNVRQSATREHLTESRESQSRYASGNRRNNTNSFSASRREDSNRGGQRSLFGHNDRRDYRGGAQGTDRPQHAKNQQRH